MITPSTLPELYSSGPDGSGAGSHRTWSGCRWSGGRSWANRVCPLLSLPSGRPRAVAERCLSAPLRGVWSPSCGFRWSWTVSPLDHEHRFRWSWTPVRTSL